MKKGKRTIRKPLVELLAAARPDIIDPLAAIAAGRVVVAGRIVTNPRSLVARDASIVVAGPAPLRGTVKLQAALAIFDAPIAGRIALDVGAASGGFTRALLDAGARRVYAVDAGHGQLLGSLRQDARVVDLEATNLGVLDRALVPDAIDVVTLDLSYLALAAAVGQLERIAFAAHADLIALVKPMFELRLARPPTDRAALDEAVARAARGVAAAGWEVVAHADSPLLGARGARELFLHARRTTGPRPPA